MTYIFKFYLIEFVRTDVSMEEKIFSANPSIEWVWRKTWTQNPETKTSSYKMNKGFDQVFNESFFTANTTSIQSKSKWSQQT